MVGATGTGKSGLSLALARVLGERGIRVEIVNADAMQLYRGMDIGTAKVTPEERGGVPHHLLDVLEVADEASVAAYQPLARAAIEGILGRGAVPILVGGSGLYVSSVLWDFRFPGSDPEVRQRLEAELAESGTSAMHRRLVEVDADAASAIGPFNARRILRALEVVEITGEPFGSGLPDESTTVLPTKIIGLTAERAPLVARLDSRVEAMWRAGLLEEVDGLLRRGLEGGITAARAIGYAQATAQLQGRMTGPEAIAETKALTRRYARRQVGWFRRYTGATWFPADGLSHGPGARADHDTGSRPAEGGRAAHPDTLVDAVVADLLGSIDR